MKSRGTCPECHTEGVVQSWKDSINKQRVWAYPCHTMVWEDGYTEVDFACGVISSLRQKLKTVEP